MVAFNFSQSPTSRTWSATFAGDADEYLCTVRALLRLVATQDMDFINRDDHYNVLYLIEQLLPEPEQLKF
jgi:hypothetical protein